MKTITKESHLVVMEKRPHNTETNRQKAAGLMMMVMVMAMALYSVPYLSVL